jgi:hypothetical protein
MKFLARILIASALLASAGLVPTQASAQTHVPEQSLYIPRLAAGIGPDPAGLGGVVVQFMDASSPLRRMWSPYLGYFYADPGDSILVANGVAIRDAFQLDRIVAGVRGRMSISIRDANTGAVYSGYVTIP